MQIVKSHGGTVIDLNTDAVACYFPNYELPFELDNINIKGHYWDDDKKLEKHKIEEKSDNKKLVKFPKLPNTIRLEKYIYEDTYKWRVVKDTGSDDFNYLVDHILELNASIFLDGRGGTGKSH